MKIALIGKSGTGKSTSALLYAHERKIPAIVDDGLLIVNGKKAAGTSAKYEKNAISAIKRATFFHEEHRKEVRDCIKQLAIERILIVATSNKMAERIAKELELGGIDEFVSIEKVRTPAEIKMAQFIRKTEGKHVIPLPYRQVEKNVFKRMIARGFQIFSRQKEMIGETTIVQPEFQNGAIAISPEVYRQIVRLACEKISELERINDIAIVFEPLPAVSVNIHLNISISESIPAVAAIMQKQIYDDFQRLIGIEPAEIRVAVSRLTLQLESGKPDSAFTTLLKKPVFQWETGITQKQFKP